MEKSPDISVCMPLYNHQRFVCTTIDSILAGNDASIELVIVDDNSTDDSFEIARAYAQDRLTAGDLTNLICVKNVGNRGSGYSLNRAALMATAPLVTFINSDDLFLPGRLDKILNVGGDWGFSSVDFEFTSASAAEKRGWLWMRDNSEDLITGLPFKSWAFFERQVAFSSGNLFIRKALFEQTRGYSRLQYCHDWQYLFELCRLCEPSYLKDRSYIYRIHEDNTFKSLSDVAKKDTKSIVQYLIGSNGNTRNPYFLNEYNFPSIYNGSYSFSLVIFNYLWMRYSNNIDINNLRTRVNSGDFE